MPILIKRGQYPTLPSDTEFTQLPRPRKPIPETRREKAPLVAEAGRDEIQASSVKLQVQGGGAQSWWGGDMVTQPSRQPGDRSDHRDLSPSAAPASGR